MGNGATSAALSAGDDLIAELAGQHLPVKSAAPTMGRLQKVSYTHEAMIELILSDPWISQNAIAAHFGYTPGWISNVLASDAFQSAFAKKKDEVVNPELKATIEERFRALVIQSVQKLQAMLEVPGCPPQVALQAAALGAKALGIGGHAPPPAAQDPDRLLKLADRLLALKHSTDERVINAEVIEVKG